MELRPAKRKKFSPASHGILFPPAYHPAFLGEFNGSAIYVKGLHDISELHNMGFFGRGNFSKNAPSFNSKGDGLPELVVEQQWKNRLTRLSNEKDESPKRENKELLSSDSIDLLFRKANRESAASWSQWKAQRNAQRVIPVSACTNWEISSEPESVQETSTNLLSAIVNEILRSGRPRSTRISADTQEYDRKLLVVGPNGPHLEPILPPVIEHLQLSFYETIFLQWALGKLIVTDCRGNKMSTEELWTKFSSLDNCFLFRYAAYHYYRSRGWVVRSGLKFGGDFLLYENGPPFSHSSYLVRVCRNTIATSWEELFLTQRLVGTVNKDVIFCHVHCPDDVTSEELLAPNVVQMMSIKEVLLRRWVPSLQRTAK